MDKLQECALAFESLLDKKYHIVIGRKGKTADFEIVFEQVHFHHLAGIHKLIDLKIEREDREKVFQKILNGQIELSSIEKSRYYCQIENRLNAMLDFEKILDNNHMVIKYNAKLNAFSFIQSEYLLSTPYKSTEAYIFLDRKDGESVYFCRSFFPKDNNDYTKGQTKYTLLLKEKITVTTGTKEVQYDVRKKGD